MSIIHYGDFEYSEDETGQTDGQRYMETSIAYQDDDYSYEDQNNDHDSESEENGSVHHLSDDHEDHNPNENSDIDEYANYHTDLEKYRYDQLRWRQLPNNRKYGTGKRKQDEPKNGIKPRKRKNVKGQETKLHFDSIGQLWYSYLKDGIHISERAIFHHWIRYGLSRGENSKGAYDFARKKGPGNCNRTCFNEVQEHWGLDRDNYAPVMFEWERGDRKNPTYPIGNLYDQGLLVIDYWRMPVRNFREIPLVISSNFEGAYMEPATRLHSEMAYEDIRARMPPFVKISKSGITFKALSKATTFSARSRLFREKAGAISWDKREGSGNIKAFIEDIVKPVGNSTRESRDLTRAEINRLRLMNIGTKPGRAKPGTTKKSKERYIANTRKAAGRAPTFVTQNVERGNNDNRELQGTAVDTARVMGDPDQESTDAGEKSPAPQNHDYFAADHEDQFYDELGASIEGKSNQQELFLTAELSDDGSPRFVFRLAEAPFLQAMTEKEAFIHPLCDKSDPRNRIPKFYHEIEAIRDALKVTVDHFKEIVGIEPKMFNGGNYISEYCSIQDQLDQIVLYEAIALRRLGRWEGTIMDWDRAIVEQDPCIGRKHPWWAAL